MEAFISGWGLGEAIKRAEAYHEAGSDGILIHSAKSEPSEIIAFKNEWGDRLPVIIVPTKYYSTPTEIFSQVGIFILQASSGGNVSGVQLNEASVNTYVEARFQVTFRFF